MAADSSTFVSLRAVPFTKWTSQNRLTTCGPTDIIDNADTIQPISIFQCNAINN